MASYIDTKTWEGKWKTMLKYAKLFDKAKNHVSLIVKNFSLVSTHHGYSVNNWTSMTNPKNFDPFSSSLHSECLPDLFLKCQPRLNNAKRERDTDTQGAAAMIRSVVLLYKEIMSWYFVFPPLLVYSGGDFSRCLWKLLLDD